jgi:TonB-linked SusC/RagA family outer membrane protein
MRKISIIRLRFLSLLLISLPIPLLPLNVSAQQGETGEIAGTVTDAGREALTGVSVSVKGTGRGTVTDADGKYRIRINSPEDTLLFSCLGFIPQQIVAGNRKAVHVILNETVKDLDEVVVVGYGVSRKRDITGAIHSLSAQAIEERIPVNVFDAMQGQIAGVEIVSASGAPGEGANIRIRGTATFEGGASPLFVVDGVPMDNIDEINTQDIQSIEVLKDAASAAIYGSRSANGVILVTTKQGEKTNPRLDIRYLKSLSTLSHKMPKANAGERRYYDRERRRISNGVYGYDPKDTLAFFNNQDIDLQELIFQTADRNQIDVSAGGASDAFRYYLSVGYLSDKGIIVNSDYNRITSRINTEYKPKRFITLGNKMQVSYADRNGISEDGVLNQLLQRVPYWAIFNPDGSYVPNISSRRNPYAVAMDDINKKQVYKGTLFEYAEFKFNSKLQLNLTWQGAYTNSREQSYRTRPQLSTTERSTGRDLSEVQYEWANENYLTYTDKFGEFHEVNAMIGNSTQFRGRENINLVGLDYTTDMVYTLNAASTFDAQRTFSRFYRHSMASFFGRAGYGYRGIYLLNVNMRYDGSSRYGSDRRWGAFPSVSAGWRFSDERFMRWMKRVVSDGKLRFSYGITGNQEIGDYDSRQLYSPSYIYQGVSGIAASNLAYRELSWEETSQYNIGLDLRMFNNRLRFIADYYRKDTRQLLNKQEIAKETGFLTIRRNVGAMSNEGFELSAEYDVLRRKNFKWSVNFNVTTNNSIIRRIADGTPFYKGIDDAIYVQENARLGAFYGYRYLGVFAYDESNAFSKDGRRLTPGFSGGVFQQKYFLDGQEYPMDQVVRKKSADGLDLKAGDVDYTDADGNGIIDARDKTLIGCAQADFYGGFGTALTYRDFSLYVAFFYSFGGDVYNYAEARRNYFSWDGATPSPKAIANMWLHPGDDALYPAPINKEHNRLPPSSFYIEDGSYIKLRNVKLTYRIPAKVVKRAFVKNASVYVFGNNLLTFTDYTGYDPEFSPGTSDPLTLGIDQNRYPRKREYGFGINVFF